MGLRTPFAIAFAWYCAQISSVALSAGISRGFFDFAFSRKIEPFGKGSFDQFSNGLAMTGLDWLDWNRKQLSGQIGGLAAQPVRPIG